MSHFTVTVITDSQPTQEQLAAALQPFHEFECTGIEDEYVVDVDRTEEALKEFADATETRLRGPDGTIHSRFTPQGEWKLEFSEPDPDREGRRREFIPPGYEKIEVPASEYETAAEWIESYFGWKVAGKAPGEDLKYGRIELDADGNVVRCIDRTNPNKKWDWWVIGGRWSGSLRLKAGAKPILGRRVTMNPFTDDPELAADQACLADIDVAKMRAEARARNEAIWDRATAAVAGLAPVVPFDEIREQHKTDDKIDWDAARKAYWEQPALLALKEAFPGQWGFEDELEAIATTRDAFGQTGADGALNTFAVLKDGKWHERGQMGWFACVRDEKDQAAWTGEFAALIDSLPETAWLTVVDCHI